jgi:lipopolysaccharide transport system permease protein
MKDFSASPREMVVSFWRNRQLIKALVEREVVGRYKGSYLGILWSLFNPLLMLIIYTFVFSMVFKSHWGTSNDSKIEFALVLFAGLIAFNFFAESTRASSIIILSNINYVKKIIFPLEVLPLVMVGSAFFHMVISLFIWFIFYVIFYGIPPITALLFPIAILPLMMFVLGLSFFLSAIGVYLRDTNQIVDISVSAALFLSPVFFPLSNLPQTFQSFMKLNPLAISIESVRDVLIWGRLPSLEEYLFYLFFSGVIMFLGFAWFQKTRKGFADVI